MWNTLSIDNSLTRAQAVVQVHWKPVLGLTVMAACVKKIWGRFAFLQFTLVACIAYPCFLRTYKVLSIIDLGGITLALANLALAFFSGGMFAIPGSVAMTLCLLFREFKLSTFADTLSQEIVDLKKENETLRALSDNWKKDIEEFEKVLIDCDTIRNAMNKITQTLQNASVSKETMQVEKGCTLNGVKASIGHLKSLCSEVQTLINSSSFEAKLKNIAEAEEQLQALSQTCRDKEETLNSLLASIKEAENKLEKTTQRLKKSDKSTQNQLNQLTKVLGQLTLSTPPVNGGGT